MIKEIEVELDGFGDMTDITDEVKNFVKESGVESGAVPVFSIGSTGAITTIEYEPGLKKDLPRIMEKIAPYGEHYEHHKTWGDDNGSGHVKASIVGPSVVVPFQNKRLILGTWQQVVVINFDTRRRKRKVLLQILRSC
ncbi:MAG: YjbQ family protein [Archaeoglobus sp.]|uniref:secondary thiamine-phosphate synthase enzyme YjbQ n=1 Tax=Archaeoglobus sp. TaxID=1872626 RepID=UPI001D51B6FB|nr:secondary thiamine-phosphate synthase enzyme YjbQ [Archaeoglobus sp.]MBO8179265.1 YjbQ family protein [Archaeoglobus sp.]